MSVTRLGLIMSTNRRTTREDYARRMLRVLVHIQEHLDETLSLEELAAVACFSPFHFHRIFTGMTGESVRQHVRRLRLERAAMRLRHSEQSVTRIALEAGYEAHEAFTRAFRGGFGIPPQQYRAESRRRMSIAAPTDVHYREDGGVESFRPIRGKEPPVKVEVKTIEPMRVVFVRHTGRYEEVGEAWERLCDFAGANCLLGPDTRFFGASHDDPDVTPEDKIRYDACMTVDESVEGEGDIGVQTIGGGKYAVTLHEGAYDKLNETYAKLFGQWFASSEHEPGDLPCIEFYLNDPNSTEPEDLLTEVCVPIQE